MKKAPLESVSASRTVMDQGGGMAIRRSPSRAAARFYPSRARRKPAHRADVSASADARAWLHLRNLFALFARVAPRVAQLANSPMLLALVLLIDGVLALVPFRFHKENLS